MTMLTQARTTNLPTPTTAFLMAVAARLNHGLCTRGNEKPCGNRKSNSPLSVTLNVPRYRVDSSCKPRSASPNDKPLLAAASAIVS